LPAVTVRTEELPAEIDAGFALTDTVGREPSAIDTFAPQPARDSSKNMQENDTAASRTRESVRAASTDSTLSSISSHSQVAGLMPIGLGGPNLRFEVFDPIIDYAPFDLPGKEKDG
jgi:hypothetical protein